MQIENYSEKSHDFVKLNKPVSYYKERYGVKLNSEKIANKKINDIQISLCKYHKVFDNVVLVESKFIKRGKFLDRKRQVSKIIGAEISANSWNDLLSKINNLYFDFYKSHTLLCKKEIYNSFKVKSYKNSSKLESVFYSSGNSKTLDELYSKYLMDIK